MPNIGNRTKVLERTVRCSRQLVSPDTTASRDSFAPCRKNSRAIARSVSHSKTCAAPPRHGSRLAVITVAIKQRVKLSGRKRRRDMAVNAGGGDLVGWECDYFTATLLINQIA